MLPIRLAHYLPSVPVLVYSTFYTVNLESDPQRWAKARDLMRWGLQGSARVKYRFYDLYQNPLDFTLSWNTYFTIALVYPFSYYWNSKLLYYGWPSWCACTRRRYILSITVQVLGSLVVLPKSTTRKVYGFKRSIGNWGWRRWPSVQFFARYISVAPFSLSQGIVAIFVCIQAEPF